MRFPSREVSVGSIALGGRNPIRLQSMTNTSAADAEATIQQSIRIFEAGADYVRIATPDIHSVRQLSYIRKALRAAGFPNPLIADIHYQPGLALHAAPLVDKIRINPGNYTDRPGGSQKQWTENEYAHDLEKLASSLAPLIAVCKEHGTAIRIGTNLGSLSQRITFRHGHSPEAMVQSTLEFLSIFEHLSFYNTVVSLKASNPVIMIQAYRLMAERMLETGMNYPMHLGVTEAGFGLDGRIKSALGIGTLLKMGIGDTVRVSLTEDPELEIPVAAKIVDYAQSQHSTEVFIKKNYATSCEETLMVMAAIDFGDRLLFKEIDGLLIEAPGIQNKKKLRDIEEALMQATRRRITKTEFIACPSCARTSYDIQGVLNDLQSQAGHIPGLTIAVMGCVVNGPGEMADADYGLMGAAKGLLWIYKGNQVVKKNIPPASAASELLKILKNEGRWNPA